MLIGGTYGHFTFGNIGSDLSQAGGLNLGDQKDGATDILLVGIDSRTDAHGKELTQSEIDMLRAGEEDTTSTDTIILIRVPNDGSSATAVSIPRDTYVDGGSDLGNVKLNAVYGQTKFYKTKELEEEAATAGDQSNEQEIEKESSQAGREALVTTVADVTGITVDHYAEVGLLGFVNLTNAVGGVDVCLNNAVDEPNSGAKFPAGQQTLDGQDALSFVRQRYDLPRGDLDRITRQQVYMASLANKVLSTSTLTSPSKLSDLRSAIESSVVLNEGWDVMGLATQMQNLAGGNVTFETIPVTSIDGTGDAGESVVTVDKNQVHAFFDDLVGESGGSNDSDDSDSDSGEDSGESWEDIGEYARQARSSVSTTPARSADWPPASATSSPGQATPSERSAMLRRPVSPRARSTSPTPTTRLPAVSPSSSVGSRSSRTRHCRPDRSTSPSPAPTTAPAPRTPAWTSRSRPSAAAPATVTATPAVQGTPPAQATPAILSEPPAPTPPARMSSATPATMSVARRPRRRPPARSPRASTPVATDPSA